MCFGPSVYLRKGGKSCPTQETNLLMLEMGYIRIHCHFALCSPFACYSLCLVPWASHTLCCLSDELTGFAYACCSHLARTDGLLFQRGPRTVIALYSKNNALV